MANLRNAYSPPRSSLTEKQGITERPLELASRWRRLGGVVIDWFIQAAIFKLAFFFIITHINLPDAVFTILLDTWLKKYYICYVIIFWLIQGFTLFTRGQTIGKMILNIRIVSADTRERVSFLRIIIRHILQQFSLLNGALWIMVFMFDTLFIISHERQCLHDVFAGTVVVQLTD